MRSVEDALTLLDRDVRERIVASMSFREGDRVPIWDFIDNRGVWEHFAQPGDDYDSGMIRAYHELGIDLCRGYGGSYDDDAEGAVYRDEASGAESTILGHTSWRSVYPLRSIEDVRAYTPPALGDEHLEWWVADQRRRIESLAPRTLYVPGCGCGFHSAYAEMGVELFSLAIYDAPEAVERIIDAHCTNMVRLCEAAAREKLGPIFFIGDDIAYKGALLYSPEFLRRTFIPALARCCRPLKDAGILVVFHSDGYIMEVLDDMLEVGIDGLNPIEPIAGMDIGLLKKRYGPRLILVGNVDCSQVLPLGSREDVVEAVVDCLRAAAPGGGHFIGSSSEVTPATPIENVLTFYEACREHGRYPISC